MKKRVLSFLVTGLVIASLAGCGTKTEATDQEVSESSSAETEEMYLYNGEGRKVGYVKTGHPIIATE